jgi:hypothetical protein
MAGFRCTFTRLGAIALSVATLAGCQTYTERLALPQGQYLQQPPQYYPPQAPVVRAQKPVDTSNWVCKAYPLGEIGADPELCKWIVAVIPQMVRPDSWSGDVKQVNYYAPARLLVINQAPAVHAEIAAFLDDLKKTSAMVQAGPVEPATGGAPKHLFHFIIRCEGDNRIDANVAELLLQLQRASQNPPSDLRMDQMLIDSENRRPVWQETPKTPPNDQPAHLTPYRLNGGTGPASSSI